MQRTIEQKTKDQLVAKIRHTICKINAPEDISVLELEFILATLEKAYNTKS